MTLTRFRILAGLLGAPCLLAFAQPEPDAAQVELAAARYAKTLYPKLSLGLDPAGQEFGTPHPPTGPFQVDYRTPEYLAGLAEALGAAVVESAKPPVCGAVREPGCVDVVVRIGVPAVTGDSARVWLYAHEDRESAEVDRELILARRGLSWVVTGQGAWHEGLAEARVQNTPCPYDRCAIRTQSKFFSGARLVAGVEERRIVRLGLFPPHIQVLEQAQDSARSHYLAFRSSQHSGATLTVVSWAVLLGGAILASDRHHDGISVAVLAGGFALSIGGAISMHHAYDHLERSIWWYNRDLAGSH